MTTPQRFFSSHGPTSDPGPHRGELSVFPQNLDVVIQAVQGLIVHNCWVESYGLDIPGERQDELQMRKVSSMLDRLIELRPLPLNEPRDVSQKFIGNCRNFALLLCAVLREQGVPARTRVGYATYFTPGFNEDHWICEYWETETRRWIAVDAQLDRLQRRKLNIQFDPLDMPKGVFITGGEAWQRCRSGQANPDLFGLPDDDAGWDF